MSHIMAARWKVSRCPHNNGRSTSSCCMWLVVDAVSCADNLRCCIAGVSMDSVMYNCAMNACRVPPSKTLPVRHVIPRPLPLPPTQALHSLSCTSPTGCPAVLFTPQLQQDGDLLCTCITCITCIQSPPQLRAFSYHPLHVLPLGGMKCLHQSRANPARSIYWLG